MNNIIITIRTVTKNFVINFLLFFVNNIYYIYDCNAHDIFFFLQSLLFIYIYIYAHRFKYLLSSLLLVYLLYIILKIVHVIQITSRVNHNYNNIYNCFFFFLCVPERSAGWLECCCVVCFFSIQKNKMMMDNNFLKLCNIRW